VTGKDVNLARLLLERGADPNRLDPYGRIPAMNVVRLWRPYSTASTQRIRDEFQQRVVERLELLASYGADLNLRDPKGRSVVDFLDEEHDPDAEHSRAELERLLSASLDARRGEGERAPDAAEETRTGPSENTASGDLTSFAEEYAAALRATQYLIDAAPRLDRQWSMSTFDRLYKIAPNEESARRIKNLFDEAMASPIADLPDRLDSPRLLEARELRPIVIELWRRKMTGAAWKESAAAIEALLVEREDEFWPPILSTQQLVFFHLFQRIGIETRRTKEDVARELRTLWANGDREQLVLDISFMYPITHVIYVDTGYGDRLLDPADYPIEIEILDTALAHYAAEFPIDPMFIHVAFEVLTSRRFLQLPETHDARAVKGELLLLQDQSGCWRPGTGNDTIHATREAVHALGRFPRELRKREPLPPSALR
jgi:hypothetical protein